MASRQVIAWGALALVISSFAPVARAADDDEEVQEVSDADLMYTAFRRWQGASPGDAIVERVVAKSKRDTDRDRKELKKRLKQLVWRDPFSEDRPVPVRIEDRLRLAARVDPSGQDAATLLERAEAMLARAEAARRKAEAARAEALAARRELAATRRACVDTSTDTARTSPPRTERVARRSTERERMHVAASRPGRSGRAERADLASSPPSAPAVAPPEPTPAATLPAGWPSRDPRGIIVVPIEKPVTVQVDASPGRRAR
jgi:hypothetical protein